MDDEPTLKLFINLDPPAIEAELRGLRARAEKHGLEEAARLLSNIEDRSREELDAIVAPCLDVVRSRADLKRFAVEMEMVQLNLPNLGGPQS